MRPPSQPVPLDVTQIPRRCGRRAPWGTMPSWPCPRRQVLFPAHGGALLSVLPTEAVRQIPR